MFELLPTVECNLEDAMTTNQQGLEHSHSSSRRCRVDYDKFVKSLDHGLFNPEVYWLYDNPSFKPPLSCSQAQTCIVKVWDWRYIEPNDLDLDSQVQVQDWCMERAQQEIESYFRLFELQEVYIPKFYGAGIFPNDRRMKQGLGFVGPFICIEDLAGPAINPDSYLQYKSAAESLSYIHDLGVIHGNVIESNCCVSHNRVVLFDFSHTRLQEEYDNFEHRKQCDLTSLRKIFRLSSYSIAE